MANPLKQLSKLRRFIKGQDVETYLTNDMRQNLSAIESAFKAFSQYEVVLIAVATTETKITHGLKVIPSGYVVIGQNAHGVLASTATAWTDSDIYLIADIATTFKLIIFRLN